VTGSCYLAPHPKEDPTRNETVWAIVASLHTRHRLHRNQAMSPGCYLIELVKLEIRARKLFVAAIPRLHDLLKSNS
jgi:hypothetical protein